MEVCRLVGEKINFKKQHGRNSKVLSDPEYYRFPSLDRLLDLKIITTTWNLRHNRFVFFSQSIRQFK